MKIKIVIAMFLVSWFSTLSIASGGGSSTGSTGPLDSYCRQIGARVLWLRARPSLQASWPLCRLQRAIVGSGTLFATKALQQPQQAIQAFFRHPAFDGNLSPDAGAGYCAQVGGQIVPAWTIDGREMGICRFSDGSELEKWTLYNGPDEPSNAKLVRFLED